MSWASMVSKSFAKGEVLPRPRRQHAQVVQSRKHAVLYFATTKDIHRFADEETSVWRVFSDDHKWGSLNYVGDAVGTQDLEDIGREQQWSWWHGWCEKERLVVNFRWVSRHALSLELVVAPDLDYEVRARSAVASALGIALIPEVVHN
jgi:hypothetical protein